MIGTLALTALLMGLAGGPHCVAMCGAACGGVAQMDARSSTRGLVTFQLGRLVGYSALGALAAASVQGLGWLSSQAVALRPVWTMFHVAALVLGLTLALRAQQPVWLQATGKRIWSAARSAAPRGAAGPGVLGALWALMPCGLLYSALVVAALAGSIAGGALVMALFALGSGVMLAAGPWLWSRLRGVGNGAGEGAWGVRLAGVALVAVSGWALWMGLVHDTAPWCLTPAV